MIFADLDLDKQVFGKSDVQQKIHRYGSVGSIEGINISRFALG